MREAVAFCYKPTCKPHADWRDQNFTESKKSEKQFKIP